MQDKFDSLEAQLTDNDSEAEQQAQALRQQNRAARSHLYDEQVGDVL